MADFLEELMGSHRTETSKQLSSNLGIDQSVASQIIPMVAPLIMAGLKRQMEQRGEDHVNSILDKHGDASALDDIGGLFSARAQEANPDPALGGLLGDSGAQAADAISNNFNLDKGTVMKIIVMLAPIILGALTRRRDAGGVGSSGIASLINQQGDSSMLMDVAGSLLGSLGGSDSGSGSEADLISGLLGGLAGKRKRTP